MILSSIRFERSAVTAIVFVLFSLVAMSAAAQQPASVPGVRPQGPCDIYATAGDPCAAAYSTTRALYAGYNGPLYQVLRQSDGTTLNIGVVPSSSTDAGGYADAPAQDRLCANTNCWITTIYDQSPNHNDLTQAPRGGFSGPAMGGFNNVPNADMAPVMIMGHKVYGVFIEPGMGLRNNDPRGTAVDDQAEGEYWVINGRHFNSACCFDFGNAEIDSRDDDNGTMEATYFGNTVGWYEGVPPGPWIMSDQENNLVGCVNADRSRHCANLPSIDWRLVTATLKGKPHFWSTLGGNAQRGKLTTMFAGPRIDATYDPMRKQGAILLGNGGDNSNGSQGTFYEAAMTTAGTYPTDATDQRVQANILAAHYEASPLSLSSAAAGAEPSGLQTFTPGSSRQIVLSFTNSTGAPAAGLKLSLSLPASGWTAVVEGTKEHTKRFRNTIAPGATVSATFQVSSGSAPLNGDLLGRATWTSSPKARSGSISTTEKVRNIHPVKINEFRIGAPNDPTDSFIELYNAGSHTVDISGWTLAVRPTQTTRFSVIHIPDRTTLAARGFYLFGLSDSGLAAPSQPGDSTIYVRSTAGMSVGDTVTIGAGPAAETRRIARVGTAAFDPTTVWQPLPDGPVITIPAGATNVPVADTAHFVVGEKIALGHGAAYPAVDRSLEQYEVATITAVGKPGAQVYLAEDAKAGATNIKVSSVKDISADDRIRLDIDSLDHGIDTLTVEKIGTAAVIAHLAADSQKGATDVRIYGADGYAPGSRVTIGTPANRQTVEVTSVDAAGPAGHEIHFKPALTSSHIRGELVVNPGTGVDLTTPLKFNHAANLPFSDRGTGISFRPAAAFARSSNEPVQALGTGITLDRKLDHGYGVDTVVRDAAAAHEGYRGVHSPNQWFGGPELASTVPSFGSMVTLLEGSMVLKTADGLVVDSLNYGALVDPWAAEGYQAASGTGQLGCFAPVPGPLVSLGESDAINFEADLSTGRHPDGADTDSNCSDFMTPAASKLVAAATAGTSNIKVNRVNGFKSGQTIFLGTGADREAAIIQLVGTAGGGTLRGKVNAGATQIPVEKAHGFRDGQMVEVGSGSDSETAVIGSIKKEGPAGVEISLTAPLSHQHLPGELIAGTGITLTKSLSHPHSSGTVVANNLPTPGASNKYYQH